MLFVTQIKKIIRLLCVVNVIIIMVVLLKFEGRGMGKKERKKKKDVLPVTLFYPFKK